MGQLANLPNIGKVIEEQLNKVGINTTEQLVQIGAENAWLKIQSIDSSACIHRLLALEGAVRVSKKRISPQREKRNLRSFTILIRRQILIILVRKNSHRERFVFIKRNRGFYGTN